MPPAINQNTTHQMRRADRKVESTAELFQILSSTKIIRLSMVEAGRAYVVPMNFGFDASEDSPPETWRIYVHCANEGRKLDIMRRNPIITFELDTDYKLREADSACEFGFSYSCLMGEAVVRFLSSYEDKRDALSLLMDHQAHPGNWTFSDKALQNVTVLALRVTTISGKHC